MWASSPAPLVCGTTAGAQPPAAIGGLGAAGDATAPGATEDDDDGFGPTTATKTTRNDKKKPTRDKKHQQQAKEKSTYMIPCAARGFFVQLDPVDLAALPCGEVKLVRRPLGEGIMMKKEEKKTDDKAIEWDKVGKHLRD